MKGMEGTTLVTKSGSYLSEVVPRDETEQTTRGKNEVRMRLAYQLDERRNRPSRATVNPLACQLEVIKVEQTTRPGCVRQIDERAAADCARPDIGGGIGTRRITMGSVEWRPHDRFWPRPASPSTTSTRGRRRSQRRRSRMPGTLAPSLRAQHARWRSCAGLSVRHDRRRNCSGCRGILRSGVRPRVGPQRPPRKPCGSCVEPPRSYTRGAAGFGVTVDGS